MTGVRTGSRLEQLEALAARVQLEIQAERRRLAIEGGFRVFQRPHALERGQSRLAELGVTSLDVKHWALHVGLIPQITRGRVSLDLIEKYAAAREEAARNPDRYVP